LAELPFESSEILEINDLLDVLEREDAQKAEIVKLRCFAGLNNHEIAALLGLNERTVRRHWELAKVRLVQLLKVH
jgi:RNA polymerase sigma factor (sigma-70 family)